jgi:hypothetical protein
VGRKVALIRAYSNLDVQREAGSMLSPLVDTGEWP